MAGSGLPCHGSKSLGFLRHWHPNVEPPAIRRDFHLDAFDVFVAAGREVENRHLGTTSTEEFITTIDRWVFTHQAGAVKEWVVVPFGSSRAMRHPNPSPPVGPVQRPSHSPSSEVVM